MYNWEIDDLVKQYNYRPPASVYIKICETSPQITHVKCDGDWIDIWADGAHWRVSPHPDN